MPLRIGDEAPDFTAETTQGTINFHDWIGDSLGDFVFSSRGFHTRLYDGTRLHGGTEARIRQTQLQDHRPQVATPVNWREGDDVIIVSTVSDEDAQKKFPDGWEAPKPYLRTVPQPKQG